MILKAKKHARTAKMDVIIPENATTTAENYAINIKGKTVLITKNRAITLTSKNDDLVSTTNPIFCIVPTTKFSA